ncbi:alpha/beta hydrolase [Maribacter antarcticus]|uniref:alpha/beta hydrolase n=1 Tax=Maribacter antarcticus TaxID=505250 RepID=UPI00047A24C6|nr:alpha/beta hydrolase-fold protein [Maribacter antarcticus]
MEKHFRTTELSNPAFESNNLRFITVKSKHLKGRGDICVFVPPLQNLTAIPLVILLHGVYGSAWSWSQQGGVHIAAWELMKKGAIEPMVIAMPSDGLWGDGSGYVPHSERDFEQWIVEDVPEAVRQNISAVNDQSPLCIAGLSMGGFGALRLGLKYANTFRGISAHSSITHLNQMALFVEEELNNCTQTNIQEDSILGILDNRSGKLPKIRFDCGTEDPLLEHNRMLHQALEKRNIPHVYQEFIGGHDWLYWQKHVVDTLHFFDSNP